MKKHTTFQPGQVFLHKVFINQVTLILGIYKIDSEDYVFTLNNEKNIGMFFLEQELKIFNAVNKDFFINVS